MKTVVFDNKMGHRSLNHINILVTGNGDLIEFKGEDIPGFAKVITKQYNKQGKWSCDCWEVAIPDDAFGFEFYQDWDVGKYFPGKTWELGIDLLSRKMTYLEVNKGAIVKPDKIQNFIRLRFPETAKEFDESISDLSILSSDSPQLLEFLQAQHEFAKVKEEILNLEKEESLKLETQKLKEKTRKVKEALKGGYTSLAELKQMLE